MIRDDVTAILERCTHAKGDGSDCEVYVGKVLKYRVCCDCWNAHVMARREVERQEQAAWRATLPICERCGKRPGSWTVGHENLHVCGRCKSATIQEHYATAARAGFLAFGIPASFVDFSKWVNLSVDHKHLGGA